MGRRYQWPYNGKKYLGNKNTMEVHDLDNEKTNCQINEIKIEHIVTFYPDNLEKAIRNGYDRCAHCLGNSKR